MTDSSEMTEEQRQEVLRSDIERTRRELGETVEELSQKANVKAQVRHKAHEVQEQAKEKAQGVQRQAKEKAHDVQRQAREKPAPVRLAAAGIAVGLVALWLIRRR